MRRAIEDLPGFDPHLAQCVLHIILSHHGSLEHGSPVVPATREAVLVHMIDNLGGRLGSFDRLERQLPAGEVWSGFDRALSGSRLLRPARRLKSRRSDLGSSTSLVDDLCVMAVMMSPREKWTDERLDDLNMKVDQGLRAEMEARFEHLEGAGSDCQVRSASTEL